MHNKLKLNERAFLLFICIFIAACVVFLFFCGDFSASGNGDAFWSYWFVFNSFHPAVGTYYLLLLT